MKKDAILSTEFLYEVISGSGNTVEAATEVLTKAVDQARNNGWIPLGDVVVVGQAINSFFSIIQVVTNNLNND